MLSCQSWSLRELWSIIQYLCPHNTSPWRMHIDDEIDRWPSQWFVVIFHSHFVANTNDQRRHYWCNDTSHKVFSSSEFAETSQAEVDASLFSGGFCDRRLQVFNVPVDSNYSIIQSYTVGNNTILMWKIVTHYFFRPSIYSKCKGIPHLFPFFRSRHLSFASSVQQVRCSLPEIELSLWNREWVNLLYK